MSSLTTQFDPISAGGYVLARTLTPRELEIMRALAQGLSNRGLASQLNVNVKTVEGTLTSIFRKLNLEGGEMNARVCAVLLFLGQQSTVVSLQRGETLNVPRVIPIPVPNP